MRRNPGPRCAHAAAEYFYPGVSPEQHQKLAARYRKWWERSGAAAAPAPPNPQGQRTVVVAANLARPAPRYDLARMSPLERLEYQVAELGADLELARQVRDLRTATQVDQALAERAKELDALRLRAARTVKVDRTASGAAVLLEQRASAIVLRAERERRAERARAAQAQAATQAETEPSKGRDL